MPSQASPFMSQRFPVARLNHQADWKDIKRQFEHCLKYCICEFLFKKSAFFPAIGKFYIFVLRHSSANFLSPFTSSKAFLLSTKKNNQTKCPRFFFFFFFCTYSFKTWDIHFPPLNSLTGLMRPVLNGIWQLLIGPQYAENEMFAYCCHLRPSSQCLSKSVTGHSVHLSTNYLLTCQSFIFPSV